MNTRHFSLPQTGRAERVPNSISNPFSALFWLSSEEKELSRQPSLS